MYILSTQLRTLIVEYYIVLLVIDILDLKVGRKYISRLSSNRSNRIRKKSSPNKVIKYSLVSNRIRIIIKDLWV